MSKLKKKLMDKLKKKLTSKYKKIIMSIAITYALRALVIVLIIIVILSTMVIVATSPIRLITKEAYKEKVECKCELYIADEVDLGASITQPIAPTTSTGGQVTGLTGGTLLVFPNTETKKYGTDLSFEMWNRDVHRTEKHYWGKGTNQLKMYNKYLRPEGQTEYIEGSFDADGFGRIGSLYVVAMSGHYWNAGDMVDVHYSNGTILQVAIGDVKNTSDPGANKYGHLDGKHVVELCVDGNMWYYGLDAPGKYTINGKGITPRVPQIQGAYVVKTVTYKNAMLNGDYERATQTQTQPITQPQTQANTQASTSTSLAGTEGRYSGLWQDLAKDTKNTTTGLSLAWKEVEQYIGHAPYFKPAYENDKWIGLNGYGTVFYNQTKLPYSNNKYSSATTAAHTVKDAACGICSTAMVMSTMTGLRVTPAEVIIATNTYPTRNGGVSLWSATPNIISMKGIELLTKEAGFDSEFKIDAKNGLDKNLVDQTLDNNGMVILVMGKMPWTRSGHYVVIRSRDGSKYYTADSGSDKNPTGAFSWQEIKDGNANKQSQGYVLVKKAPTGLSGNTSIVPPTTDTTTNSIGTSYILYKVRNCTCEGEYCNCHKGMSIHKVNGLKVYRPIKQDTETTDTTDATTNNQNNTQNGGLTQTVGNFQGNWGGTPTIELLMQEPVNRGNKLTSANILKIRKYSGSAVLFNRRDEYANKIPKYSQFSSESESWRGNLTLSYALSNTSSDLQGYGCAFYMGARITSILQNRLINPAEMLGVYHHFGVVTSSGDFKDNATGLNSLLGTMGYKVEFYSKNQIMNTPEIQTKLQQSLQSGIPCGYRTLDSNNIFNNGNHFMTIDAYTNGTYIMTQSGKGATENKGVGWQTLLANMSNNKNGLYIVSKK